MTKRSAINIYLMCSILLINELHMLFRNDYRQISPFLYANYQIDIAWYVKFLSGHIADIIKGLLIYRLAVKSYYVRQAAAVYLAWTVLNLITYLTNFNRVEFTVVYLVIFAIMYFRIFYQSRREQPK